MLGTVVVAAIDLEAEPHKVHSNRNLSIHYPIIEKILASNAWSLLSPSALAILALLLVVNPLLHPANLGRNFGNIVLVKTVFDTDAFSVDPDLLLESSIKLPAMMSISPTLLAQASRYAQRLVQLETPDRALVISTALLRFDRHASMNWYVGGIALLRLHQFETAEDWFQQALLANNYHQFSEISNVVENKLIMDLWWPGRPDNGTNIASREMTYVQLSAVAYHEKNWQSMELWARRALESNPEHLLATVQLAVSLYRQGMDLDDRARIMTAQKLMYDVNDQIKSSQYPYFLYLGRISRELGERKVTRYAYGQLALVTPHHVHLEEIVRYLLHHESLEEAKSTLIAILERGLTSPELTSLWAYATMQYLEVGDHDMACNIARATSVGLEAFPADTVAQIKRYCPIPEDLLPRTVGDIGRHLSRPEYSTTEGIWNLN